MRRMSREKVRPCEAHEYRMLGLRFYLIAAGRLTAPVKAPGGRPGASPRPPRTGKNTGRTGPPGPCTGRSARIRGT